MKSTSTPQVPPGSPASPFPSSAPLSPPETKPDLAPIATVLDPHAALQESGLPPAAVMMNLTTGALVLSRCLFVAAELGLSDLLRDGPRPVSALAAAVDASEDALYRVLRALASAGIFREEPGHRFALTPLAETLCTDVPGSLRSWVRYGSSEWQWSNWAPILGTIRNGKTVHENVHKKSFFAWYAEHPAYSASFDAAMSAGAKMLHPIVVSAYDFSKLRSLVDIGGGTGALLAAILEANPHLHGTLLDQPSVIARARAEGTLAAPGLAERAELVAGDFFTSVPAGHDAYLLKWILHDWTDEECLRILRACRAAAAPGSMLLIVEMLVPPGNGPALAKMMDVCMLALTGGRERTAEEFTALLRAAGFELRRVIPTPSPYSMIEACAV
ncbi:MAG: methyltransferase [Polyangia bacterium]